MADGDFPDTYETKTTTTTTSSTTVCTYNAAYIQSVPGMLRIAQIVVGLIYWIVLAATYCTFYQGFLISVTVFAWIFTIILFVLFLFMIADRINFINWPLTEFINNVIWGVLHIVGIILVIVSFSKGCRYFGNYLQIFLSIGITLLYAFHAFILFRAGVITFSSQTTVQT